MNDSDTIEVRRWVADYIINLCDYIAQSTEPDGSFNLGRITAHRTAKIIRGTLQRELEHQP